MVASVEVSFVGMFLIPPCINCYEISGFTVTYLKQAYFITPQNAKCGKIVPCYLFTSCARKSLYIS